jgi:hypothetical protein
MAHRDMKLTEAGALGYRTRMLSAGDTVSLPAPTARLFRALKWAEEPGESVAPVSPPAPPPAPPPASRPTAKAKAAPRKRAAPKKAQAKK